jgi:hypothetical protein
MALTDQQKLDFLFKKVMFGFASTDTTSKDWSNETITSPLALYGHEIWADSGSIPATPPLATAGAVQIRTGSAAVECVVDTSVEGMATWIAVTNPMLPATGGNRLRDWIPPSFGVLYSVMVYAGNPEAGGTLLFQQDDGLEWVLDYPSGVLHFPNGVPSLAQDEGVWLVGYRYVGAKGVASGGVTGSQVFQVMLNYSGQTLDTITGLPAGWAAEIDDPATCRFTLTHTVGRPPSTMSYFGQGPSVGTTYRLRKPTTMSELIYDTATPDRFTVTNATPFATGAQSSTNSLVHIFF